LVFGREYAVHAVRRARGAAAYGLCCPCVCADDDVVKDCVGGHAVLAHLLDDLERLAEVRVAVSGLKPTFESYRTTLKVRDSGFRV
jgi:hypothetical protein